MFVCLSLISLKVPIYVQSLGSLVRRSKQRVSNLNVDNESRVLSCHVSHTSHFDCLIDLIIQGVESFGEFFRISTTDEIRTRLRKRLAKARKRKENGDEAK